MRLERWVYTIPLRLRTLFRRARVEEELEEELHYHIDRLTEQHVALGMAPAAARTAALRAMGGIDRRTEEARDARGVRWVEDLVQDVRYALRQLRRSPGATAVVIATLALGIGANTSIFSVVNAVLFRPLPFEDSHRLVLITEGFSGLASDFRRVNAANYLDFQDAEGRTFESVALIAPREAVLVRDQDAEPVAGAAVTPSLFRVLRVRTAHGRPFVDADAEPGAERVALLSDAFWRRRLGAEPGIIGTTILFASGPPAVVVGIMPPDFILPLPGLGADVGDVFFPFSFTRGVLAQRGDSYDVHMIGRLRDDVTVEQARGSLVEIAKQLPHRYPETYGMVDPTLGEFIVNVGPVRSAAVMEARRPLLLLLGAVGLVLLIACINVSSLVLARSTVRRREIAVRRALGATRGRLSQQFLVEALVLVGLGGAIGVAWAKWAGRALAAAAPGRFYSSFDISVDGRVLAFTLTATATVAVLLSLLPALHASEAEAQEDLRDGTRATAGVHAAQRGLRGLVVAEIALATMLAIGAGLLLRSLAQVHAVDPGFDTDRLLTFRISFPVARYPDGPRIVLGQHELARRLREVPGVQAASGVTHAPLSGLWQIGFTPDGDPLSNVPTAANALVLPDYFETLGVRVRHGRTFGLQDASSAPPVVIVSETLARQYYGTTNAVGRRFKWGTRQTPSPWSTIVGVVADVKQVRLDEEPFPAVYMPRLQQDTMNFWRAVTYLVRTGVPPATAVPLIREAIRDFDAQLLLLDLAELDAIVARTVADRRFNSLLFGLFAALALTLAAIGVYGVMQYSVAQRTREMGIRMAFGARRTDLVRLGVGDASRLAVLGIAVGLAGAFALTRILRTLLFETSPLDVPTFAAAASILLLVALLASYLPVRRALRADPMVALRRE